MAEALRPTSLGEASAQVAFGFLAGPFPSAFQVSSEVKAPTAIDTNGFVHVAAPTALGRNGFLHVAN